MKDISLPWHELALYGQHDRKLAKLVIPRNLLSVPKVLLFSYKIQHFREGTAKTIYRAEIQGLVKYFGERVLLWTCITTVLKNDSVKRMSLQAALILVISVERYIGCNVEEQNLLQNKVMTVGNDQWDHCSDLHV